MSSYAAFTLLKTPPRNHLKLHWRTHILSVPQLHVKNIILLEKRLVRFPLSSGTVMIVRKQSIPKKTITTGMFPFMKVSDRILLIQIVARCSTYLSIPTIGYWHVNMPLQTPRYLAGDHVSNHWRCRDKQDSCLNQVHGVCFGMRLRQEPSPGFTAGRQYKTTDSSIAKGSYFQPYWTHTSSTQCSHYAQHGICKFTIRAPLNPKSQQVVAQTVAYEVSPSSSMTAGVRKLDPAEPK
ncbi:hypothetical protein HID58_006669 [Brassica napus]|uniref:Uncharacterized protein n=1 Tax=Brassica napus TaxID=3708 RepID=A0ABQ8EC15_BRANA|nr:hypothetical protein HID58_006669 [Brassica napus]